MKKVKKVNLSKSQKSIAKALLLLSTSIAATGLIVKKVNKRK